MCLINYKLHGPIPQHILVSGLSLLLFATAVKCDKAECIVVLLQPLGKQTEFPAAAGLVACVRAELLRIRAFHAQF